MDTTVSITKLLKKTLDALHECVAGVEPCGPVATAEECPQCTITEQAVGTVLAVGLAHVLVLRMDSAKRAIAAATEAAPSLADQIVEYQAKATNGAFEPEAKTLNITLAPAPRAKPTLQ